MSSRFDKWLRPILEEAYQEMFPTPPTIQGRPVPGPVPTRQPTTPARQEDVYPSAERDLRRPRIERLDPRDQDAILERDIRRPRTEEPLPRTERPLRPTEPPPVSARRSRRQLRQLLGSQAGLRQAVLVQEILGPPKALREERDPFSFR